MNERHKKQVSEMIGKKVKVYVSGKKIERVLREDRDGLFIRYENERVQVRPDTNTLNILSFLALSPKDTAAIAKTKATQTTKDGEDTKVEEVKQDGLSQQNITSVTSKKTINQGRKVVDFYDFKHIKKTREHKSTKRINNTEKQCQSVPP